MPADFTWYLGSIVVWTVRTVRTVRTNMIISVSQQEAGFEISVISHKSNEQFLC